MREKGNKVKEKEYKLNSYRKCLKQIGVVKENIWNHFLTYVPYILKTNLISVVINSMFLCDNIAMELTMLAISIVKWVCSL